MIQIVKTFARLSTFHCATLKSHAIQDVKTFARLSGCHCVGNLLSRQGAITGSFVFSRCGVYPSKTAGKKKEPALVSVVPLAIVKEAKASLKMKKAAPCVSDYLACREAYQVEYHRFLRLENMLKETLKASDSADFERKLLLARSQKLHPSLALIALYHEQGSIFDQAASLFDLAEALQKKRVAASQAELAKDLAAIDC